MHIAIDARAWRWTGVGRYIRSLIEQYAHLQHGHTFTLLVPGEDAVLEEVQQYTQKAPHMFTVYPVKGTYYSMWEQVQYPLLLSRIKADLFHFPHFNVPLVFTHPFITTIHDVTRFYFPGQKQQGLMRQIAYEAVFKHAVESAKHVIAVSQHTKQEIMRLYAGVGPYIDVIHEGVGEAFAQPASDADIQALRNLLGTKDPYLLIVGVWMSHKNVPRILRAFHRLRERHPNLKLVITGNHKEGYIDARALAIQHNIEKSVVFPGFVPNDLLPVLYQQANMLVFASLYEGFGLPALEAAAGGVPVVAANVSSLPEVMNDAARYVNPESEDSIAAGMQEVLENEKLRETLIARGRIQAQKFSWKTCAQQTLKVYEAV